jgi:hypothetical protein
VSTEIDDIKRYLLSYLQEVDESLSKSFSDMQFYAADISEWPEKISRSVVYSGSLSSLRRCEIDIHKLTHKREAIVDVLSFVNKLSDTLVK